MKLSEVRGIRTFDVIADCIEPIANIAADKQASKLFERKECPEGKTPREFMAQRILKSLPYLLRNHQSDLVTILATIKGVSASEYEKSMNLATVIRDVTELITDEDFAAFLSQ